MLLKDHQAIDILLAEIDIYELFAFKHCKGRKVKLALCEELDERMRDLRNQLQSFEGEEYDESHKKKAIKALKQMESLNLFNDTYEGHSLLWKLDSDGKVDTTQTLHNLNKGLFLLS